MNDQLSLLMKANISLRAEIKKLKARNAKLSKVNGDLNKKYKNLQEKLKEYGIGRPNQYVNGKTKNPNTIRPDQIQAIIERYYSLPHNTIKKSEEKKKRSTLQLSMCRFLFVYFTKKYTGLPLKRIGQYIGYTDHSTAIYAIKEVKDKLGISDENYVTACEYIESEIQYVKDTGKVRLKKKKFYYDNVCSSTRKQAS